MAQEGRQLLSVPTTMKRSTIYVTLRPLCRLLDCCGFCYNGSSSSGSNKLKAIKMLMSIFSFAFFIFLFAMNIHWGMSDTGVSESLLLRHSWHKLYLLEFLFLAISIARNFYYRQQIGESLQLMDQYDVVCQVSKRYYAA